MSGFRAFPTRSGRATSTRRSCRPGAFWSSTRRSSMLSSSTTPSTGSPGKPPLRPGSGALLTASGSASRLSAASPTPTPGSRAGRRPPASAGRWSLLATASDHSSSSCRRPSSATRTCWTRCSATWASPPPSSFATPAGWTRTSTAWSGHTAARWWSL